MPLKRGSRQPGDTGRRTRNPFGGPAGRVFCLTDRPIANWGERPRATKMSDTTGKRGFTTAILHSDRATAIEHGALHKPLHTSVAYGYQDANELAAVFQGRQ